MSKISRKHFINYSLAFVFSGFVRESMAKSASDWFEAARFGDTWTMSNMLFDGFDINARNDKGYAALHAALIEPNLASVRWLARQNGVDLNVRNAVGETALMQAIIHGHRDIAMVLLEAGAEVNQTGWTPLHYAAASKAETAPDFVKLLLESYSAYIDAESPNGTTPLMMAARYGLTASVRVLLDGGADISLQNKQGLTALDFANASEHPDSTKLVQAVFKQRADELAAAQAKRNKLITPTTPIEPAKATAVGGSTKPLVFETIPKGQW